VLSQNYKNLEFIILDGGSTDGTQEIIKRYEKHLTFWRSGPDGGHYASVQEGFARCSGSIMSWINADDALAPYSLNLVAALFSAQTGIEWLTGQHCIFTEERELETGDPMITDANIYFNDGFDEPFIQQEGTFWTRQLWERAGGSLDLSLDLAADMELWTRFFLRAKLFVASVPLGIFQRRAGQRSAMFRMRYYQEAHKVTQRLKAAGLKPFQDPTDNGAFVPIPCES
jgi:cellulose synthase/poly-beta-1,6-N-acetylglucosamine synthase-like glycosyltransferase